MSRLISRYAGISACPPRRAASRLFHTNGWLDARLSRATLRTSRASHSVTRLRAARSQRPTGAGPNVRGGRAVTPPAEWKPLMQQYREIKARHPDTFCFFEGDFTEMFEDDARRRLPSWDLPSPPGTRGRRRCRSPAAVKARPSTCGGDRPGHRVAICEQWRILTRERPRARACGDRHPGHLLADDCSSATGTISAGGLTPRSASAGVRRWT